MLRLQNYLQLKLNGRANVARPYPIIDGVPPNVGEEVDDEKEPPVRLPRQQIEFQDTYENNEYASEDIDPEDEDEPSAEEVEAAEQIIFPEGDGPRPRRNVRQGRYMLAVAALTGDGDDDLSSDVENDSGNEAENEQSDG